MFYYTYLLKSITQGINKTYVGYSTDVEKRLSKHNNNTGAKSTKGYKWKILYKKKFKTKNAAMSYEYKLKNSRLMRQQIILKYNK